MWSHARSQLKQNLIYRSLNIKGAWGGAISHLVFSTERHSGWMKSPCSFPSLSDWQAWSGVPPAISALPMSSPATPAAALQDDWRAWHWFFSSHLLREGPVDLSAELEMCRGWQGELLAVGAAAPRCSPMPGRAANAIHAISTSCQP